MSKKYSYAKAKLPDWDKVAVADLRVEMKAYVLESVLRKRKESTVFDHVRKLIDEFAEEFDDSEKPLADSYREELASYAKDLYDMTRQKIGSMTPAMFAAALASPDTVSVHMREEIGKAAAFDVTVSDRTAKQFAKRIEIAGSVDVSYSRATPGDTYYREIHKEVKRFLEHDFPEYSKSKDYQIRVNPRNVAEANVRFRKYQEQKASLIADGVRFVYVPSHSNCSERCQPFQGRLYSLDGTKGTHDGRSFIPIEDASEKVTVTSKKTRRTYPAGLFSYNCRHRLERYRDGQNIEQIPKEVIEKQRALEAEQRHMEREIRLLKEQELLYRTVNKVSPNADLLKTAREAKAKAQALTKRYEVFSDKHKIPFYRERVRVVQGEDIYRRTRGKNDPVLEKI
ncbi:MAG: hypothetical protein IKC26_02085 [Clostridia bacterium]|nr:hypothetical protein [Clostridia bacterium]